MIFEERICHFEWGVMGFSPKRSMDRFEQI
jgi:hypothetical protein